MSEKLCLQWNDFKDNLESSFRSLREDSDFVDVTLACDDGQQVEAHKVILAASSPIFENLLKRKKHVNPMIYMRGVKIEDLSAILDFLYYGEANVFQDNLDSFLALAEELQLKGLRKQSDLEETQKKSTIRNSPIKATKVEENDAKILKSEGYSPSQMSNNRTVALIPTNFSGDLQHLGNKVNSMMVKTSKKKPNGLPLYACTVCGKEAQSDSIKKHIEVNHLEGVAIPCNLCEKFFKSTRAFVAHNLKDHKKDS